MPGLVDELVPAVAAMREDVVVGREGTVRQPAVAHELLDVLDRVELRRSLRYWQQSDVVRGTQMPGGVPACLIEQHDRMGAEA
jgi:hypothetical protein